MKQISLAIALILAAGGTSAALGQATGGGPEPGTGDASRISSNNQQQNADYNRLVGAGTKVTNADDGKPRRKQAPVAATLADITPGSQLRDSNGEQIATVVSVEGENAMVDTGETVINVPVVAFGKDDRGLLLGITAAQFNDLVKSAN